jgi:hypothetical protein
MPALSAALARERVAAAGRRVGADLARLRSAAIVSGRVQGLRVLRTGTSWAYEFFEDGDGDGLRTEDIAAGRDRRSGGPVRLADEFEGVDFGLLDRAVPEVPPGTGALDPGSDPIRFGRSDIVSFTPHGTSSSGSFYVSDGARVICAVVLYGGTGKIRALCFDRDRGTWKR